MAGIYRNQTEGIISLSSDGTTRITIADKNLGATQVYNDGDTLSEANAGKYYQRGNNYGFPFTGSVTTSSTKVNAGTYGPGNYYSSSTFIVPSSSPYNWDTSNNSNLWGGVTGTVEAMQGPCPSGFHIPTQDEWNSVASIGNNIGARSGNDNSKIYLKMPLPGFRAYSFNGDVRNSGIAGIYLSSTIYSEENIYSFLVGNSSVSYVANKCNGYSIRPFANTPVVPDYTWTKIYGDDILPPFLKRFIKNGNYYYFGDAPIHISGLALDKSSISLTTVGQTEQLTATISPEGAVEKTVTWSSSDTSIATVDNTGLVTCVTPGECTITATCGEYSASCSVIQKEPSVEFLLIGGGGAGGSGYNSSAYEAGGGGGAGGVIHCECWIPTESSYCVRIGRGGCYSWDGGNASCLALSDSCLGSSIIAYHGGYGCRYAGCSGGSGGGGGSNCMYCGCSYIGGSACSGQGYKGGNGCYVCGCRYSGGGGGGAGGVGGNGTSCTASGCGGAGGLGICTDISGTYQCFAGGGGGGGSNSYNCGLGCYGGGNGGTFRSATYCGCPATTCGSGGGGGGACYGGDGACGLLIVKYKTGDFNMTGGTCYTCGDYTIHCFTSSGTLTVN